MSSNKSYQNKDDVELSNEISPYLKSEYQHNIPEETSNDTTREDIILSTSSTKISKASMQTQLYPRRWIILVLFSLTSATSAFQWIHLNIIQNVINDFYSPSLPESVEDRNIASDWLSMIYMLSYILFVWPCMYLLDYKGLAFVFYFGSFLNALGAWIKCIAINPNRFGVLMTGQTICAIAQAFILGLPTKLAAVWFGSHEVSTATSVGVLGNQFQLDNMALKSIPRI